MSRDLTALKHELSLSDLFYEWDSLLLELVASICQERTYGRGDVIFAENGLSDELYIIASGTVEIRVHPSMIGMDDSQGEQVIAVLRRGQNFGEVALLDEGRRTASAVAVESNTRLIVISRDKIITMCENVPKLGYLLMRNLASDLANKIRKTDIDIRAQLTWVPNER